MPQQVRSRRWSKSYKQFSKVENNIPCSLIMLCQAREKEHPHPGGLILKFNSGSFYESEHYLTELHWDLNRIGYSTKRNIIHKKCQICGVLGHNMKTCPERNEYR